jgi:GT2 family glycosyltransferase
LASTGACRPKAWIREHHSICQQAHPLPRTVIAIVNWNGASDTVACLDSLLQLHGNEQEIVVVDNASADDSVAAIAAWAAAHRDTRLREVQVLLETNARNSRADGFLTLVRMERNAGFAGANNVAIEMALKSPTVEFVWILNNDTEILPDSLTALQRRFSEDPSIGMCGSTLVYAHHRSLVQTVGCDYDLRWAVGHHLGERAPLSALPPREYVESRMSYVPGASMLVSRAFLETIGPMEEKYFLYGEELDWALRGEGRFRLAWAPESIVFHKEGASIGTGSGTRRPSLLSTYYLNRSTLHLIRTFRPAYLPTVLLRMMLRLGKFITQNDLPNAAAMVRAGRDFALGRTGPAKVV